MTMYEWLASNIIGVAQCALIACGLRTMRLASENRDREGERRHAEAMEAYKSAHAESMTALKELISRTGRAAANEAAG